MVNPIITLYLFFLLLLPLVPLRKVKSLVIISNRCHFPIGTIFCNKRLLYHHLHLIIYTIPFMEPLTSS